MFALTNPIRDKGKQAAAFGSYGWSGEEVKIINPVLSSLKLKTPLEPLAIKFSPDADNKEELVGYGRQFADRITH